MPVMSNAPVRYRPISAAYFAVPAAAIGLAYACWTLWGAGLIPSGASFLLMAGGLPFYWWARRTSATP